MSRPDDPKLPGFVLNPPAAPPDDAHRYFMAKLAVECDAWDVHEDRHRGRTIALVDARTQAAFADMHIPGAVRMMSSEIHETRVAPLRGQVVVVYCWGTGCNAATKVAARLTALGIQAKEMIGGLEAWVRNGYPVDGALPLGVNFDAYLAWHHQRPNTPFRS